MTFFPPLLFLLLLTLWHPHAIHHANLLFCIAPYLSPSFCWHAWGIDQVLIAQSSCQSHPSILVVPHHQAGVCHCLHRSHGFVLEVTDSCREGGARQTELLDLMLTSC